MPEEMTQGSARAYAALESDGSESEGRRSVRAPARRILRLALEEILGRDGLIALLKRAGASTEMAPDAKAPTPEAAAPDDNRLVPEPDKLLGLLEAAYGQLGGRGIAVRVGRACFHYGLRAYGQQVGADQQALRLLPLAARIRAGLQAFADLFNVPGGPKVWLDEHAGDLVWRVENCPLCESRHADEPICYLAVGLLQEALYWLSGGKIFRVEEIGCLGHGDSACSFLIDETPIE